MKRIGLFSLLFLTACGANDKILRSGKETPSANAAVTRSALEDDLTSMRNADFRYVFVIRRKDGGPIDAEDRSVIKVNTMEANRRISSDSDRAFIIGTNNPLPPEKLSALYARFAIEDHSPPPEINANTNAIAAPNANGNTGK